ncbi:MAG: hypothetical protein ACR2PA_21860, partial [Hyphomicrobiaceae bacterium]
TMLTLAPASFRHVGREWHLDKRPAYSRWRMYFFTPLWDPKEEAKQKSEARQKARPKEPTEQGSWKGFALVLLLRGSWFLVKLLRRAEAAHSVNRSYALYLTVLSYQALRKSLAGDYERSHARLLSHLSYVRGSDGRLFGVAKNGPIPVKSSADEERLQRQFEHFIV